MAGSSFRNQSKTKKKTQPSGELQDLLMGDLPPSKPPTIADEANNAYPIFLPVSKKEITLERIQYDPRECVVHARNQRNQELLDINSPATAALKISLDKERQRDPALARWIQVVGKRVPELLDGSRRRFVLAHMLEEGRDVQLDIIVGDIPDEDAEYLAKKANDYREDISPWEVGQDLQRLLTQNPSWGQEKLAANEGMSQASISNYLSLAKIPIELVSLLDSPNSLKVESGKSILQLLSSSKFSDWDLLAANAPYPTSSSLLKAFQKAVKKPVDQDTPTANKKIEVKSKGKTRAKIGVNRNKPGQYKVDLFDVTEDEYKKIMDSINSIFGG